ncbi:YCF48-related protein [Chitinophaga sp. MM2321]|uniref:WD40/YVTN/BNR-like repeat-containing protein n=1 Tax=Chitinophaga sp. MM2321 TaxID=3137178 RepID=UPI0032D5AB74
MIKPSVYTSDTSQWTITAHAGFCGFPAIIIICFNIISCFLPVQAQNKVGNYHIKIVSPDPPLKSIRGISAVTDDIVWVSGTGGKVGKSTDGGNNWQWMQVSACDSCDWRSIYAFDDKKALVLNAGEPARLFLTTDGGSSWQQVFSDTTKGIFFDAMDFFNDKEGIAIGDPLQNKFTIIRTHDGGQSWQHDRPTLLPAAIPGEALFAASGTSLITLPGNKVYFGTGGTVSRLFQSGQQWKAVTIPVIQGKSTTGTFSIAFLDANNGIAVGGDYQNDTLRQGNCMLTNNGGRSWFAPSTAPGGYKSGVAYITPQLLIATGTSGTDISNNGGRDWHRIGDGFNVVRRARNGKRVFLAGKNIGLLTD